MPEIPVARICAVVVTYEPDLVVLGRLLEATRPQVEGMLVVDNASPESALDWLRARAASGEISLLALESNHGVAGGHNRGIAWARERGFTHVLMLDQDSLPAADMVRRLLKRMNALVAAGAKVAAVGPRCIDDQTGTELPFLRFGLMRTTRIDCRTAGGGYAEVDMLITSGKLISLDTLEKVGAMDEGLFIDNVDIEWGFRAQARGFALIGDCDAVLHHRIGDLIAAPWWLPRRRIMRHSPLRLYYMMRNRVVLYFRRDTPMRWVSQDVFRLVFKFALFVVFVAPRLENARMMLLGVVHGLAGRQGRFKTE